MWQRGTLHFVQRARVAEAQRKMHHPLLRRPRVDRQEAPQVRQCDDVAVVHSHDGRPHAVHEADGLIEVLRQRDARAYEDPEL